jgi:hypothetical protein
VTGAGDTPPPPEEPTAAPPRAVPPRTPPPSYLPPPPPRPRRTMEPIEPLPPERTGPPPWVWVVAGVAAAVVLAVVLVLVLRSGSSGPVVVGTDVTLDAVRQGGTLGDGCSTVFHFTASGSVSGSGTIVYRFERSDGQSTPDTRLSVDGNTGFEITQDWRFMGMRQGNATMVFRIVSPTTREVRREITATCPLPQ